MYKHAFFIVGFLVFLCGVSAEDWPQWRGPSGNATSSESGLPIRWSAGVPPALFQDRVGYV